MRKRLKNKFWRSFGSGCFESFFDAHQCSQVQRTANCRTRDVVEGRKPSKHSTSQRAQSHQAAAFGAAAAEKLMGPVQIAGQSCASPASPTQMASCTKPCRLQLSGDCGGIRHK